MNVPVGERWEGFGEQVVKNGRYGAAFEAVSILEAHRDIETCFGRALE